MTPFQALAASFHMLLAKAREPIQERELAPAPTGAAHRPLSTGRSNSRPLKMAQTGRRKTDSLVRHDSVIQRWWKTIVAWIEQPHTGTRR